MTIHVNGVAFAFELRTNPWTTIAGERFARLHGDSFAAFRRGETDALPAGVVNELMRVLYVGPHDALDWEYDVPRMVVGSMMVAAVAKTVDELNTEE